MSKHPLSKSENPTESLYNKTSSCENPKKRNRDTDDLDQVSCSQSDNNLKKVETNLAHLRFLSAEQKAEEEKYGVSTELPHMTNPSIVKKVPTTSNLGQQSDNSLKNRETNLSHLRVLSAEEEGYGVSTEPTVMTDPWVIKKILIKSDTNQSRLFFIKNDPIQDHILKHLTENDQNWVKDSVGLKFNMYDHDTDTTHEVVLKKLQNRESFVLDGGWGKHFARRRDLRKGDEVGMYWDRVDGRLHFRVLSRATTSN